VSEYVLLDAEGDLLDPGTLRVMDLMPVLVVFAFLELRPLRGSLLEARCK
jgi:hypothetical protein